MVVTERGKAAWILALLSPVIAELMSGSSPPLEFFNPFMFVGLLGMYGAGVLVVRELTISWGKGWGTVIILGAAYGIIEEGVAVKSFFDPGWMDLGDLAEYGRYWSTNWVWAVWLTIYHSVISMALPILLLSIIYPEFRGRRLLTDGEFRLVIVVFALDIAVFALVFMSNYVPPLVQYLLAIGVVWLLLVTAKRVSMDIVSARHALPTWKPWRFYFLGLLLILGSFLVASGSFTRALHPLGTTAILLMVSATALLFLQHRMGRTGNEAHKAAFAGGLLTFLIILGFLQEFAGALGMSAVSVAGVVLVIDLNLMARGRRTLLLFRRRTRALRAT